MITRRSFGVLIVSLLFLVNSVRLQPMVPEVTFLEKQQKVLQLLSGLGSDIDIETNKRRLFKLSDPTLYEDYNSGFAFKEVYRRGVLPRNGVFSWASAKNRKDTFRLINVFVKTKDTVSFFEAADWGKSELNPVQFAYAFIIAIYHRKDMEGITLPPLYEILPHYFVTSDVMQQIYRSKLNGRNSGRFIANTTCWEWSWYREMTSGPFLFGQKWNGEDPESAISYFREDVHLSDWYTKFLMINFDYLSNETDPAQAWQGELYYSVHNWLLRRYNLERYAVRLRPTALFHYNSGIKFGYNPRMTDMFGRPFLGRADDQVPMETNGLDFQKVKKMERRLVDSMDIGYLSRGINESTVAIDEKEGLKHLTNLIFGLKGSVNKQYYGDWFFAALKATNDIVLFSNDRELTTTVLGEYMTALRDPIFYMLLVTMDKILNTHLHHLPTYTRKQMDFPGVNIKKMELSRMETIFEMYDFDATNGVPSAGDSSYTVSQFRLNHMPFNFTLYVEAKDPSPALVRVFIGPKLDLEYRPLTLTQAWFGFTLIDYFEINLTKGDNVIDRSSEDNKLFEKPIHYKELYEKVNKSVTTKNPLEIEKFTGCGFPKNLMVPLGSPSGKEYQMFVIIYPKVKNGEGRVKGERSPCPFDMTDDPHSPNYPFDRWPDEIEFQTTNMIFKYCPIYHRDLDLEQQSQ